MHCAFKFLIAIAFVFTGCKPEKAYQPITADFPTEIWHGINIKLLDSGTVKMVIKAPEGYRLMRPENILILSKGIEITCYENDTLKIKMRADFARYDDELKIIYARGNILIESSDGRWLKTDEITYDITSKKISSYGFIQIKTDKEIIWGRGFKAPHDFSEFEITEITGKVAIQK